MTTVSVTELRRDLPAGLKRGAAGEEVRIPSRGRVIARLTREADTHESATDRLEALRGTVIVGDILAPDEETWTGDDGHL